MRSTWAGAMIPIRASGSRSGASGGVSRRQIGEPLGAYGSGSSAKQPRFIIGSVVSRLHRHPRSLDRGHALAIAEPFPSQDVSALPDRILGSPVTTFAGQVSSAGQVNL